MGSARGPDDGTPSGASASGKAQVADDESVEAEEVTLDRHVEPARVAEGRGSGDSLAPRAGNRT